MSQSEVLKIMEKQPKKWFTTKELALMIQITCSTASVNLLNLLKCKEVLREKKQNKQKIR